MKEVIKPQDDVKTINKEKQREWKRLYAEIGNNKKRLNPQEKTRQNWKNNTVTLNQLTRTRNKNRSLRQRENNVNLQ